MKQKLLTRSLRVGDVFRWNSGWKIEKTRSSSTIYLLGADTSSWGAGANTENKLSPINTTQTSAEQLASLYSIVANAQERLSGQAFTKAQTTAFFEKFKVNPETLYFRVRYKGTKITTSYQCDAIGNLIGPLPALSLVFDESKMVLKPVALEIRAALVIDNADCLRTPSTNSDIRLVSVN